MPQPPPRPAPPRPGGPASPGSATPSGTRTKDGGKEQPGTFFLGRYRVVDEIGVGGMASVHLARMDGPGGFQKWVAIKRIHPHLVEDDQFVDMFLDEARIAAGINHANVAQVFDLGKDDNTYWIAMEYLHGEPLREVMRRAEERGLRIGPELAARICADAAEGLHAAHELRGKNGQLLGLVHRDVTPHNLFLTYDGYTKVVDFGIAKVADRLSSTRAGTLKGKLAYMSPEQVRGAEVDRTTDIFALGVVLWEITTNQRLFRMDTDLDTLEKVQACIVPPPSTLVPGYPPELEACVLKALSKRKQDRYQSAREFSRALQTYLVRSGHFVGPEEVAQFVRGVFADRIQKREAHLAWAAEVTGTINVDQLRGGAASGAGEEANLDSGHDGEPQRGSPNPSGRDGGSPSPSGREAAARAPMGAPPRPQAPPAPLPPSPGTPPSGERPRAQPPPQAPGPAPLPPGPPPKATVPIASQSLMDDDEDVPTTVAMREQLDSLARAGFQGHPAGPRPAAGLPAPPPPGPPGRPQAHQAPQAPQAPAPPAGPAYGHSPASYAASAASYAANVGRNAPSFGNPPYTPHFGERTTAMSPEDLGSTIALPSNLAMPEVRAGPPPQPPPPAPSFGFGPPPPANGQGYGAPPQTFHRGGPAPTFGLPQGNPALTPAGLVGGVPMHYPIAGPPGGQPQSQIETALSLPRPDPAALWLAQQEKQKGDRRHTGVLIAVVALTALCVLGIGALIYFKLRARAHTMAPADVATAGPQAAAPGGPAVTSTSAIVPAAYTGTAKPTGKDEPGYLTIVCDPSCDDVVDQGSSLGASVTHLPVAPGPHHVTLKKGRDAKTITVTVVSGQISSQRVAMK